MSELFFSLSDKENIIPSKNKVGSVDAHFSSFPINDSLLDKDDDFHKVTFFCRDCSRPDNELLLEPIDDSLYLGPVDMDNSLFSYGSDVFVNL